MKKIIFLIALLLNQIGIGQNLVPNPSFEDTTGCGVNVWPELPIGSWFSAQYSPDLYSNSYSCFAGQYPITYQNPRTGLNYIGLYFWQQAGCVREYPSVKLTQPLVSGNQYCLEFYYSRHESYSYSVNRMGAYFSADTVNPNITGCNLQYLPQISTSFTNPTLDDTLNWILFSGNFIASGGEQFLTIGNFASDDSTVSNFIGGPYDCSYYFIDDVSLINCSVGMADLKSNYEVKAIVSPTENSLTLTINKEGTFDIEIYDMGGKVVLVDDFKNGMSIDISSLSNGIYVYEIHSNSDFIFRDKFIK